MQRDDLGRTYAVITLAIGEPTGNPRMAGIDILPVALICRGQTHRSHPQIIAIISPAPI
jgi:hypothetical protein